MVAKRTSIPKDVRDKVLVDAMHRCCLCPEHQEVVDLHHVVQVSEDGPNTEDNLMAVCPTCHAKIHRIRNRYTPEQLRMYKERWGQLCALGLPLDVRIARAFDTTRPPTSAASPVSPGSFASAGSIPTSILNQCRNILLRCHEFESDAAVQAVFVTDELRPFRDGLPEAASKSERVDRYLAFLLERRLSDGRSVFPLFLKALHDRYQSGDALRDEVDMLVEAIQSVLAPEPSALIAPQHPQLALKLFKMDRKQAHQDRIVFSPSKEQHRIEGTFGLALENITKVTPAKGIFIRVEFSWRGRVPRKAAPVIFAPHERTEWTPPFSELLNEKEAVLNLRDPNLVCVHGHPEEWDNFRFVLQEAVKGFFLIKYTISTLEPVTEICGELRIVIGDDTQGS